jgi:hypothetical protein
MIDDISKSGLYFISELDNWNITEGSISKIGGGENKGQAKKLQGNQGGGKKAA